MGYEPILGEKIQFIEEFKRIRTSRDNSSGFKEKWKEWISFTYEVPKIGIIVGIRTLYNGRIDYDSEVGPMFSPKENFKALLVSTTLYRKPILIPFSQWKKK